MGAIVTNNAVSTLSAGITSGATSLSITSGDEGKFPSPGTGEWFPVTLVDTSGNLEIAHCTARSGTTLTVKRGQEGTSAQAFLAGTRIDVRPTAELLSTALALSKNALINGNFDFWQRGASQTDSGYSSDDRWANLHSGSTKTHSQQAFTLGQTDIPGNPKYFSRTAVTSVAGSGNYAKKLQRIEGVEKFAGETATLSFNAKADAAKNIAVELEQYFGTGGTPSSAVTGVGAQLVALTTAWQRFSIRVDVPSISGKTLGTNGDDFLGVNFWFDAGSSFDARTASLGQQSGTFDIAQVQLENGAVATEFEKRFYEYELMLCQRYFWRQQPGLYTNYGLGHGFSAGRLDVDIRFPVEMRTGPSFSHTGLDRIQLLCGGATTPTSVVPITAPSTQFATLRFDASSVNSRDAGAVRPISSDDYFDWDAEI